MPDLPSGTVTFLFSDIEGSTRLAQERPEAWPELLARHHALVRAAVASHGGAEVSTEGDAFFIAFDSASAALAAAADIQRALAAEPWPEGAAIRVRIGLHTGEASIAEGTYVGIAVHRAARIMDAGHGGQVLLSAATRALTVDALPPGASLLTLGRHRLKDLDAGEELSQLVIEGLPADFPPLRALDATPNNLPTQATSFLGREDEIAEVSARMDDARLLTLTGPGGTGKTRLSLQVAARVADRYPDGVRFVALGAIGQAELVLPTIAHELGLPDRGGQQPRARILEYLADRRVLLVLDNFEQVMGAAPMIGELLAGAPRIGVLATSRSPLHVYGEQEYPVPPLDVPDPNHLPGLESLSQFESVALFIERARAAVPGFAITNDNAPAVAEICYRLDGLPLAIELAAARIKLLSPQAMLQRLGQRLAFLAGGARDLPARQQTLRGAIEWSYDLLDEGDRRLFAALSTFVGGADFAAVEAVGADPEYDVFECLGSLVDKSLVRRGDGMTGEARFTMLGTIREYALERRDESGRADELRDLHRRWFLDLAERAAAVIMGSDKRTWLDRLEEEHDNLRAALEWSIERGDVEMSMRMVAALWRFWQMRGYLAEGLERARAALRLARADEFPECRARALDAAGGLAYWTGDGTLARSYYEQSLELQRELGNRAGEAWALYSLGFTYLYTNVGAQDPDVVRKALPPVEESVRIYREIGDRLGSAMALWGQANVLWTLAPDPREPEFGQMRQSAIEALEIFREAGDSFMTGWATYTLALSDIRLGEWGAARGKLREALVIFHEAGDISAYVLVLDGFAALALREGDAERAARLSGAVRELERRTGTGLNPSNRIILEFDPIPLETSAATRDAWIEGAGLSADAAIAYAIGAGDPADS
jgi:predicted ATPase/class 3 adenylate cyclase